MSTISVCYFCSQLFKSPKSSQVLCTFTATVLCLLYSSINVALCSWSLLQSLCSSFSNHSYSQYNLMTWRHATIEPCLIAYSKAFLQPSKVHAFAMGNPLEEKKYFLFLFFYILFHDLIYYLLNLNSSQVLLWCP